MKDFPILLPLAMETRKRYQELGCPKTIPWSLILPHERQAQINHYQTLKRLAERGGLSPSEAVAVLKDRTWKTMPASEAIARLIELVNAHV